jgi:hypothetical protein
MVRIHHEASAAAPVSVAFGHVDDYRNTVGWMFGLAKFSPAGELDHGLGATFDATFQIKPITLHSTVECTAWEQDTVIAFRSIKGFVNASTWRFIAIDAERSTLSVDFEYELPGGLAGKALGRALEPIVTLSIRHTEAELRKQIEAAYSRG